MSGSQAIAAFVCPFFRIEDPDLGPKNDSTLGIVLKQPEYAGVDADTIVPGMLPVITDKDDNVVAGGVPAYGVCLWLVKGTPTLFNALDAITDVWRLDGAMTDAQRNSVRTKLAERGLITDFGQATTTAEMANRVARVLIPDPEWGGISPAWVPTT